MTLYKYLHPDRVDVLRSRRIRFTQPTALNDPFELAPYFETVVSEAQLLDHLTEHPLDLTPHLIEAYDRLPEGAKAALSLAQYLMLVKQSLEGAEGQRIFWETFGAGIGMIRELSGKLRQQLVDMLRATVGILSLSEVADCAPMWAHYADQHRGFVLGFNEEHPFFSRRRSERDEFFFLRPVVYRAPAAVATLLDLSADDIMVSKSPEWSYEQEWRMLMPLTEELTRIDVAGEPVYLADLSPSAVSCVILGAKSSDELQSDVRTALNAPDYEQVQIQRATLDARIGKVVIGKPLGRQADV